jgi:ABC-type nitrate/sulfonate/bicarbonate transport system substrate-binding protein
MNTKQPSQVALTKRVAPLFLILALVFSACRSTQATEGPNQEELQDVTLMLDWVPNTNHSGLYVAQANGYFESVGLSVQIIEPGEVYAEQAVVSGLADFGISFQEQVTLARGDEIPIVSIAAIIQHNTSGFASRASLAADRPEKWAGLTYGGFGSPFEEPTLKVLMQCDNGNFEDLEIVNVGFSDPLALLAEEQIDLAWIFFGWQGTQADLEGIELNLVMMEDWFDCIPDYYTPVLIASEETIQNQPATVSAFLEAVAQGYSYAIENPEGAADILLEAAPELGEELVRVSQQWLAPRYTADADQWGVQKLQVWQDYADWMTEHGIITTTIDAGKAFTNEFLP